MAAPRSSAGDQSLSVWVRSARDCGPRDGDREARRRHQGALADRIEMELGSWGVRDRWGDHELLFRAARLHLAILDVPVHYQERVYRVTKMVGVTTNLFRMLRMCAAAAPRLKSGA
jgi:hypothetical protein